MERFLHANKIKKLRTQFFRETTYSPVEDIQGEEIFQKFQDVYAEQNGYMSTGLVVVNDLKNT